MFRLTALLGVLAALWTIWELPASFKAGRYATIADQLFLVDPQVSVIEEIEAVKAFPFENIYRQQSLITGAKAALAGMIIQHDVQKWLWDVARRAAGNDPNVLLARLVFLLTERDYRNPEVDILLARSAQVNPRSFELWHVATLLYIGRGNTELARKASILAHRMVSEHWMAEEAERLDRYL